MTPSSKSQILYKSFIGLSIASFLFIQLDAEFLGGSLYRFLLLMFYNQEHPFLVGSVFIGLLLGLLAIGWSAQMKRLGTIHAVLMMINTSVVLYVVNPAHNNIAWFTVVTSLVVYLAQMAIIWHTFSPGKRTSVSKRSRTST